MNFTDAELRRIWRSLVAYRCPGPGCDEPDVVCDTDTDEWWTLDETDYTAAGSSPPDEHEVT